MAPHPVSSRSTEPVKDRPESHWAAYDAAGIQTLLAVEDRHFWFRARNQIIRALVTPPIQRLADGFRILEVGCGSGNVLRVLKTSAAGRGWVEGLEVSVPAASVARERTGLTITNGHLADLARSEPYDIIAAFDVLEHIWDDIGVVREMRTRLKSNGRLILTVPAHPTLWSPFDVASEHMRRYTPVSIAQTMRTAGFEIEYLSYFMFLLYPVMWLRRRFLKSADLAAVYDSEFQIVPGLNEVAFEVFRREARLIRARRRLPMGTSLAIIARPFAAR
jgi:2-polyprenyl-3-methyl-5-hydroxy-6-metoxy-1,4-benzoquinol methylase